MPVLMVHGAGGGGWEWVIWRRVFEAAGHRVVAPDLQPLAEGLAATRLSDYSRQVRSHLQAMAAPRILVGASLGGLLAWMNADLADALVLVNPIPASPWHARLPARMMAYASVVPWASTASLEGTRRSLLDADEAACLFAFRRWRDESGQVMNHAFAGVDVPVPACPSIIVVSENDDDIPAGIARSIADSVSATCITLPGASHVGPLLGRGAADVAAKTVAILNGFMPNA